MRPLVVIGGPIHRDGIAELETVARVVVTDQRTEEGMIEVAREAAGILFLLKPGCTRTLMAACPSLKVVGRLGVGLDTVDLPAATDLGIAVVHAPGSNSDSVAEHALMLILVCAKQTFEIHQTTRSAQWKAPRSWNVELKGKTLGIVGVGNIGRRMARFGGALGMTVIGYDKYLSDEEMRVRGAEPRRDLAALLREADVVTCHTPHTPETNQMIDAKAVAQMKDGVIFVNTSRGKTQDERALFEGLTRGKIRAAGLDVFEEEPVSADNPLLNLPNVVLSSHVAGVTTESLRSMAVQVTEEMVRVLRGEKPHVLGNPDLWPRLAHLR
jgi:D-3-phosphoglycerate dehydrogenase / 2-oxoglutarate reductase